MERIMSLGEFIAKRRKYMRLTQERLAEEIHVSKSAVAKWETDGGIPDRDNLKALADVLRVSLEDMYRIMDSKDLDDIDLEVNVTPDLIAILESYGYIIIKPKRGQNITKQATCGSLLC